MTNSQNSAQIIQSIIQNPFYQGIYNSREGLSMQTIVSHTLDPETLLGVGGFFLSHQGSSYPKIGFAGQRPLGLLTNADEILDYQWIYYMLEPNWVMNFHRNYGRGFTCRIPLEFLKGDILPFLKINHRYGSQFGTGGPFIQRAS